MVATGDLERFLTTKGPGAQPIKMTKDELLFGVPAGGMSSTMRATRRSTAGTRSCRADVVRFAGVA
jgi:hypothetical protein